ncbi:hypothetical protein SAMN05216198_0678 [Halopseudomonas litoralis]|uniref:Uncharacterized protein n=1 Tax=Halopseudomonas litoralis TaxID=797277 RepID=A0A1H1MPB6_9GAMM|nr:hypothetical protein [Halopseudomonas litoralis]SDR88482.1 hypothetical protein SAMN05216198_0678 [Halopseudomonas litoralis]
MKIGETQNVPVTTEGVAGAGVNLGGRSALIDAIAFVNMPNDMGFEEQPINTPQKFRTSETFKEIVWSKW